MEEQGLDVVSGIAIKEIRDFAVDVEDPDFHARLDGTICSILDAIEKGKKDWGSCIFLGELKRETEVTRLVIELAVRTPPEGDELKQWLEGIAEQLLVAVRNIGPTLDIRAEMLAQNLL